MGAWMDRDVAWAVYNETGWDPFYYFTEPEVSRSSGLPGASGEILQEVPDFWTDCPPENFL